MLRPSPPQPCRRAFPCSPPFIALRTRIHDTSYPSGGHRLVGPAWVSDLNRLRKLQAFAFGTFRWLTRSDLGRIAPLPLAWSRDRIRRTEETIHPRRR